MNTFSKKNNKPNVSISKNIDDEIRKLKNKNKVIPIQPLHVTYEGKIAESNTKTQYLAKLRTVYKLLFDEKINESIINE